MNLKTITKKVGLAFGAVVLSGMSMASEINDARIKDFHARFVAAQNHSLQAAQELLRSPEAEALQAHEGYKAYAGAQEERLELRANGGDVLAPAQNIVDRFEAAMATYQRLVGPAAR